MISIAVSLRNVIVKFCSDAIFKIVDRGSFGLSFCAAAIFVDYSKLYPSGNEAIAFAFGRSFAGGQHIQEVAVGCLKHYIAV